ncbi:MAG: hypothetical protein AAF675_05510 [Pseudomonadota bacterium]
MQIVLHPGVWKTGSSAIQMHLRRHHAAYASAGLAQPAYALEPGGQHALSDALREDDGPALAGCMADIWAAAATGPRFLLLSSEHLWPLSMARLQRLARALAALGAPVLVRGYVRAQEALWPSVYAQQAKMLHVRADHPLWGSDDYARDGLVEAFDFDTAFARFEAVWGREAVALKVYDRDQLAGRCAATDFLSWLGVPPQGLAPVEAREANPSFGWKGVAFALRLAERLDPEAADGEARACRQALRRTVRHMASHKSCADWLGAAPGLFDPETSAAIRAHYATGNARLAARHFEGRLLFEPRPPAPATPPDPARLPKAELRVAERLFRRLAPAGVMP